MITRVKLTINNSIWEEFILARNSFILAKNTWAIDTLVVRPSPKYLIFVHSEAKQVKVLSEFMEE